MIHSLRARLIAFSSFISVSALILLTSIFGIAPAQAFAGTLENGNLAYAQSTFNKGEACDYLPGFEQGYDAWHFVLTTRGAVFQQDPTNPKVAINLNFIFMRQDGTTFSLRSGAWVQFGKGAYVYTLTSDRIRLVQAGTLAKINVIDSGMRLSHTCPGVATSTITAPTPTPAATSASPTPTQTATPTPAATSASPTPTPTPTATTVSPSPTPTTSSTSSGPRGILENGNGAPADSEFNKGEACIYLPGFEKGYDAWHFVLTTRGTTFYQDPTNPAKSIRLNFVFTKADGSKMTFKNGAWVQFGKGAYVYTLVSDKAKMVQSESYADVQPQGSGMRLSHTCPGGTTAAVSTPSPSPTPAATSASPTPTPTTTKSASATPTPTPTPTTTKSQSASPTPKPTPTKTLCPCDLTKKKTSTPFPVPAPSKQPIGSTPTPIPTPTKSAKNLASPAPTPSTSNNSSPSASPAPSTSPSATPSSSASPSPSSPPTNEPTIAPPAVPTPPPVEDPKKVIYVDPETPTTIDPKLPETPAAPLVITKEPELGKLQVNDNGTFTYTPPVEVPEEPVLETFEFSYTDLAGKTVIVRKEIILTKKGDVPSIIQTGSEDNGNNLRVLWLLVLASIVGYFAKRRKING